MSRRGVKFSNSFRADRRERRGDRKYYGEHDDRDSMPPRIVKFKPNKSGGGRRNNPRFEMALLAQLEDDVDMSFPGSSGGRGRNINYKGNNRSRPLNNNRSQRRGSPSNRRRNLIRAPGDCYMILLPHGGRYPKDYILKTLKNYIVPQPLIPIAYKVSGNESTFFVDDFNTAVELMNTDKKITTNDGFKLVVKVRPAGPYADIDPLLKERMKQVMGKRYNAATRALDLSRFHVDPELMDHALLPLCRSNVFKLVVDIIVENVPEIVALNLSDNRLTSVDALKDLPVKAPNITTLHIGKNKIKDLYNLESIKDFELRELMLDGNPLCSRYKQETEYVSAVRKIFPKLLKLDGVDLPPPITFDISNTKLPPTKGSFVCAPEGQAIVHQFLEQYYILYDGDQRKNLVDAYTDTALFSLSSASIRVQSQTNIRLDEYIPISRNLKKVTDPNRRHRFLHIGKTDIVSFLDKLPKTQHDPSSFIIDLTLFMPQIIMFNVTGLFREPETRDKPIRAFCRTFVLMPVGTGFCIINEEYFITNPTIEQCRAAFKTNVPAVAPPPAPVPLPVPVPAAPQMLAETDVMKLQMVEALAAHSNMNLAWSKKCLDETNWNYEQAITVFTELHKQGTIPAEAFVK